MIWEYEFQSPRGDFGFLKSEKDFFDYGVVDVVSIPSRGFWFFEVAERDSSEWVWASSRFNPLAGILVF